MKCTFPSVYLVTCHTIWLEPFLCVLAYENITDLKSCAANNIPAVVQLLPRVIGTLPPLGVFWAFNVLHLKHCGTSSSSCQQFLGAPLTLRLLGQWLGTN